MTAGTNPDRDEVLRRLATEPVLPVVRRLLADGETPVGLFRKLAGGPGSFLLESAEPGRSWSRYSFVGVRCPATLTERDGRTHWVGEPLMADLPRDPLAALGALVAALRSPRDSNLPPLTGGMVGYIGYDTVRRLERLPDRNPDELQLPELAFLLATDLAVLDHVQGSVLLVANVFAASPDRPAAYHDAVARLDAMTAQLRQPGKHPVNILCTGPADYVSRTPPGDYAKSVQVAKEHIRAGDIFQVVLSQRFEVLTTASALDIYRVMRTTNPSPYMYLLRFPDGVDVIGSSPEALVTVKDRTAIIRPIAGTRPRHENAEEDKRLAAELLADEKERAEHLMLVDLARNDLGRICQPGSVDVVEFMSVARYSHVMHLESTVSATLAPGCQPFDVLRAAFPAGTLSGAPKPRAMELIEELEPSRRGIYGGAVGYLDFADDIDVAIAIRTAVLRDGVAYVQAGAGIVADSDPVNEEAETRQKAQVVLQAIATAERMREIP
ncbi:MAG: anthranilate synthase component I [Actinomycetota bacterium]|nr:anthranilate synthase component I [Actinomycetota bacterium]